MSDRDVPVIAERHPAQTELESGKTYYWCRCGRSKNQPFCDGSHKSTDITPLAFTPDESGEAYLCQCKASGNAPYCDGTHKRLGKAEKGDPVPAIARDGAPTAEPTPEEPTVARIHEIARGGLARLGHHGAMGAMGVPRKDLPHWDDIQILTAQLARKPLMEDVAVGTELVIGPKAKKPLELKIPLFVSDMSFGALSEEAKTALARGAELAGTGICSGEGGMLPEEQEANSRYFYELASAKFGWDPALVERVQAFHFKGGQGAKTGTGGHLPGSKVTDKIAAVRGLAPGQDAVSPPTFADLHTVEDYRRVADEVRERSGGIPVGFKLSANHIEDDIDFALAAGADYVILDGRGGGTGAAPLLFRDHISVPTIPALARARRHLDAATGRDVTLIITGGLRLAEDFVKAMALGADGVALANSAIQAVGCVAARMCNTNNCPAGVATQKPELRARLDVDEGARRLANFLEASVHLMQVMARACGHDHLSKFVQTDLTTWKRDMADLSGVAFGGCEPGPAAD
jgi:glutamate synthase domain-containing protein 2/CDGSH-type Zn-finger protein